jgi:hypothetical protein
VGILGIEKEEAGATQGTVTADAEGEVIVVSTGQVEGDQQVEIDIEGADHVRKR